MHSGGCCRSRRVPAAKVGVYPRYLEHEHTLFDGRRVLIRPVRDDDERLEDRFVAGLSGESRYLRFQKWIGAPSANLLRFLTHVDYATHLALVCVAHCGDGEQIVGEARYVINPDGKSCDFAIVVADDWHKSGVAGLLMAALMRAARDRGLASMESPVLRTNGEMLRFARGLGFRIEPIPGDIGVVRVVRDLSARP